MPEDEERCPDCDSVAILPLYSDRGDGKCSTCHGTGKGDLFDGICHSLNPFSEGDSECDYCHSTGICQTCGGTGVI